LTGQAAACPIVAEHSDKAAEPETITEIKEPEDILESKRPEEVPASRESSKINNAGHDLFTNTRIIGQAFSTYILLEGDDELYLLDQHAAHERIRYEELKKGYENNDPFSQILLSVIHVDLTSSEYQFALSETEFFRRLGFTFEGFGTNSIILRSAPFTDDGSDIREGFLEILDFIMSGNSGEKKSIADEALYRMACRSAVKAHKKLETIEIEALLANLSALANPYTCPHGRPAILKLRRYELEKLFKRIV
jgi:DNA mismatch repair protein MutL